MIDVITPIIKTVSDHIIAIITPIVIASLAGIYTFIKRILSFNRTVNDLLLKIENIEKKMNYTVSVSEQMEDFLDIQRVENNHNLTYDDLKKNANNIMPDELTKYLFVNAIDELKDAIFKMDYSMQAHGHAPYEKDDIDNYIMLLNNVYKKMINNATNYVHECGALKYDCFNKVTEYTRTSYRKYCSELKIMLADSKNSKVKRLHSISFNFIKDIIVNVSTILNDDKSSNGRN